MKTYHNVKWNFTLDYPEDWDVMWENVPDGGWEVVVGVAGKPSLSGRPYVTVRVLQKAVLNFYSENVSVRASGGPGQGVELPRTVEEYHRICKQELMKVLPDVQFIADRQGVLAGMASGTLRYSYRSKTGVILETQINIFGSTSTYRLLCEAPEEQSESVDSYFDSVVAAFIPFAKTAPEPFSEEPSTSAADGNQSFLYVKEGYCPVCRHGFGTLTGWEFGPTTIRCKGCGTILDAHAQWKDWATLSLGVKARLVFENVGLPMIGPLIVLALILIFTPDVLALLAIPVFLLLLLIFIKIIPFFRRVSESKKLSKENKIPVW